VLYAPLLDALIGTTTLMSSMGDAGNHEKNQKANAIGMAPRNQRTLIANSATKDR